MLITVESTLWPDPITFDTDAPSGPGPGPLALIKPKVEVRLAAEYPPIATWTPHGEPRGSSLHLVWMIALAAVVTFAAVGVVKSLR